MKTNKKIILTVIHLFIFISSVILTIEGVFFGASKGQLGENMINLGYFKAFTMDSNDFAGITSLIMAIFLIRSLINKDHKIPYCAVLLHYISAVSLGLTFLTTATFLAPTQVSLGNSYWTFFQHDMFFFHFLNPVLSIFSFIFITTDFKFGKKESFFSIIPMVLYAIIYLINVVFLKIWSDFYGFTFGGRNFLILPVLSIIIAITWSIGALMIFTKNKITQ